MSFGPALEFVWSSDGGYAVRQSTSEILMFSELFEVLVELKLRMIDNSVFVIDFPPILFCLDHTIFLTFQLTSIVMIY